MRRVTDGQQLFSSRLPFFGLALCVVAGIATCQNPASSQPSRKAADFATEVLPLFQQRCISCHGPQQQMSGYRLDSKKIALTGGASGPNIVPGRAEASPLFQRIAGIGNLKPMPMAGPKLTADQVALVKSWIDGGAHWPDEFEIKTEAVRKHWAYIKPVRPNPPDVRPASAVRNPIDNFVLAKLQAAGLTFSPEASKERLIRRLSFDLRGLPPTLREIDDFIADQNPRAYEALVDRMLASPAFGEHWARQWLDLARYADTNGYESDEPRTMWAYRDWVIDAFNRNMPFDRFTIEQLAGDLLPQPTIEQIVATGFHRNTMVNNEAGTKDDEFRDAAVKDRVDTTATVWLGSTLGCAQCHDHKYDPFKQAEYYQLYAIFNNTAEASTKITEEKEVFKGDAGELQRREAAVASARAVLEKETPAILAAQRKWEAGWKAKTASLQQVWTVLKPDRMHAGSGAVFNVEPDGSISVRGETKASDAYEVEFQTSLRGISGLRIDALPAEAVAAPAKDREPKRAGVGEIDLEAWSKSDEEQQAKEWSDRLKWGPWVTIGPFRAESRHEAFSTAFPPESNYDQQTVYENGHLAWIKRPWQDGVVHYFRYLPDVPEENCAHYAYRTVEAKQATTVTVSLGSYKGLKLWLNRQLVFTTDPTREIAPGQDRVELRLNAGSNEILIKGSNDEGPYGFYFQPFVGSQESAQVTYTASADDGGWEASEIPALFDGKQETTWNPADHGGTIILQMAKPFGRTDETRLKLRFVHDPSDPKNVPLRHFRVSATTIAPALVADLRETPERIRHVLAKAGRERSPEEVLELQRHYRLVAPELAPARQHYHKLQAALEDFRKHHSTTTLVMRELAEARKTYRQNRGSFLDPAEAVEPGVPAVLHPIPRGGRIDRLVLARWLMDANNPLTARVRVNQIWLYLLGQGLVATPEDFGTQSDPPSHPELLDWLATEFMRSGWNTKALVKTIVTSATYRQASETPPEKLEKDPENKLLSRGVRYRFGAETVRDAALAASGLLTNKIGGASVFPPQPAAVFADHFIEGGFKTWPSSKGEDRYRRGLYTFYKRTLVYPTFVTFDAPDRSLCTVRRPRSNTPLQALDTLNNPVFFEAAGKLAERMLTEVTGTPEERLNYGFRLVLARRPRIDEGKRLLGFYESMRSKYQTGEAAAKIVTAAFPVSEAPAGKPDLPAWVMVANVILNLDEAVSRE